MSRLALCFAFVALVAVAFFGSSKAQNAAKLEPQDYVDIRQLIDGYSHLLDHCTNGGYDYADLFTDDGTFGVSSEWGRDAKIWFRGREQLAVAAGGGRNGCQARPSFGYHLTINPVITPTADGARAVSTLLTITNDTNERGDIVHWQGGYEDTFRKTRDGWRFESRVHVWPEIAWTDRPEDMPPRDLASE
jgi:SnoaL-like domain